ncbi:MAG: nitroreductase family deazaflavin-dependent oxidoreductase [Gammaproteobacteria bacterium]|jgi:deazaflavin-dependent oxidoreductase (nitroreductase family)|nr:nitroreductase family deazaflavin-dependent oxidoreductase [Gammaproteobacteria bacterium]|tara:strand:+ start:1130 stop:1588 length:459 start_codon:yes stop_codon:yes gene_type:complete
MSTPAEDADDLGQAPPPRWLLKAYTHVNVWVYKLSGGRMMNTLAGMPIVLIKMTRARSGTPTTIPLMYVPHKDGVVLVASQGGAPKNPGWYYSLTKNPEVEVTQGGKTQKLRARRVSDEEKAELWPTCVKHYPPFQQYQNRTERNIPVFLCE